MQRLRKASRLFWIADAKCCLGITRHSTTSTQNVPAGHHSSDLSSSACNIGLNRRRDITLRQDIRVHCDGKPVALSELFKDRDSLVIGIPDLADSQQAHVHGYVKDIAELQNTGFKSIYLSAVTSAEELAAFLSKSGADACGISAVADSQGTFTRMLGLDINPPGEGTPHSQRYMGLVQDGILTRICVEKSPEHTDTTSSDKALQLIRCL